MKRLLILLAVLLIPLPVFAKPPVWVVKDADSTLVLFGSIHLLPEGRDWRPKALDDALAKADDLWFELPMGAEADGQVLMAAMGKSRLPEGQTLSDLLSKKGRERLQKHATRLGLPMAALDQMQPWMAEVMLTVSAVQGDGGSAEAGVEKTLANAAPQATRRAFETPADQINLFAGADIKTQLASLEDTLKELSGDPKAFTRLVDVWMKGDVKTLHKLGAGQAQKTSPDFYKRMIKDRNERWLEQLKVRLAGSGETVVVVGAGHLTGKDGLPTRLRAMGYRVEGP